MGGFLQDNFLGNSPHVCPSQVGNREDDTQAVCQVVIRGRAPPLQCCSVFFTAFVLGLGLLCPAYKDTETGKYLFRCPINSRLKGRHRRTASNRNYVLPVLFAKAHTCVSDSISLSKHLKDIIQPIANRLPHLHSTLEHGQSSVGTLERNEQFL
jgi:hypothetical protein